MMLAIVLALLLLPVRGFAQPFDHDFYETPFYLYATCKPMGVHVSVVTGQGADWPLIRRIRSMVESRLQAAQLYDPSEAVDYLLSVVVMGDGGCRSIEVCYQKPLYDPALPSDSLAVNRITTWEFDTFQCGGEEPLSTLSLVSSGVDTFIRSFLRVNQNACRSDP